VYPYTGAVTWADC